MCVLFYAGPVFFRVSACVKQPLAAAPLCSLHGRQVKLSRGLTGTGEEGEAECRSLAERKQNAQSDERAQSLSLMWPRHAGKTHNHPSWRSNK